ncbi:tetratricopeptide repeat protein [Streptomyces sp. HUAS MG47]|uniref:tetratricopeptide repeat protein n=1 Tax=Streptomyces solicamelliae TaxID=3231716 RepID=UPI003877FA80
MIQQYFTVGMDVIVHLRGGRGARGRLQAIGNDSVVLATETGPALLSAAAVELIEMAGAAASPAASTGERRGEHRTASAELSEEWDALGGEFPAGSVELTFTRPSYRLDAAVPLPYSVTNDVRQALNRARNRVESARLTRDGAKAGLAVRDLAQAGLALDYPPALHLAALLLLEWEESEATRHQAGQWLELAAHLGGRYAWDLAVLRARSGHTPDALAALGDALHDTPAQDNDDLLLRAFLDLALHTGDSDKAARALSGAVTAEAGPRLIATRAALHLVRRLFPERAAPLEPLLSRTAPASGDLRRVLDVLSPGMLERLGPATSNDDLTNAATNTGTEPGAVVAKPRPTAAPEAPRTPADGRDPQRRLEAAQRQFQQGNLDNALRIARTALDRFPSHPGLLDIVDMAERELAARAADRSPARPRPARGRDSLNAKAQYAATREKDWQKAEALYRQVLEEDPGNERARRSLAWGLHRGKRSEEALEVLRVPGIAVQEVLQHQNMIIAILGDCQRWSEAAQLLEELLDGWHSNQTRTGLLKRLIVLYRRLGDAEQAKGAAQRLLQHGPRNPEFISIAEEIAHADRTGVWDTFDGIVATSDWQPERAVSLSSIVQMHLDRCEYAGVSAVRIQEGSLSELDVQELVKLIERLGPSRPADRAAYNLSAACILRDLDQTADDRFRRSLRGFGAAMGDLCTVERKPPDVTRAYYTEAVSLGGWDDMGELKVKQFVTSYLDPDWQQPETRPPFELCMSWVLEDKNRHKPLAMGLVGLLSVSSERVRREIISRTYRDTRIREVLVRELRAYLQVSDSSTAQNAYTELWEEAFSHHARLLDAQRDTLQLLLDRDEPLRTLTEDQEVLEGAAGIAYTTPLDRDRFTKVAGILAELRGYLEQPAYLEQERLESRIRATIRDLVNTIERLPTRISLEFLVPPLENLESALTAHFRDVQRAAEPTDLDVEPVLSAYTPNAASLIHVQLSVTNLPRRSPAVDVRLRVLDNDDDYEPVAAPIPVAPSLRDEQTETCTVPLVLTPRTIGEKVATLRYCLEFTLRSDQRLTTEPRTLSLRLSAAPDWEPIQDPFAEGAPVQNERMFFGRDRLIERLAETLRGADAKCVVIYGQKRVGKSSVLHHLQKALEPPLLAAKLSLLDIATDLNHASLLYRIASAFHHRLEDLEDAGYPPLDLERPVLREFTDSGSPHLHFDAYLTDIQRHMRRSEAHRDWRMVLLLDEFTVLYSAIERGALPREFMKSWKALLESRMFSSVVVGNDLMPRFLKMFPNEFQVARQEPVSYLDENSAQALITEPIALADGGNRYRGDSVQRIIALTARSPYYIQLLCSRLVQHMNAERQPLIGPADVDAVASSLTSGEQALLQEQFDNLLTPGDADVSELSDDVVLTVLKRGLSGHRRDLHIDGRKARELSEGPRVLEDLLRRDVIERESADRYRIKVGLFAEWLWHRRV